MRKIICLFLGLLVIALSGCKIVSNNKGSLVIRNESGNSNVEISAVYVMPKGTSGYNLVFSGSIQNGSAHFIELEAGEYSVMIYAKTTALGVFSSETKYETGYNIYKELDENGFITVIFDGKGIYFE